MNMVIRCLQTMLKYVCILHIWISKNHIHWLVFVCVCVLRWSNLLDEDEITDVYIKYTKYYTIALWLHVPVWVSHTHNTHTYTHIHTQWGASVEITLVYNIIPNTVYTTALWLHAPFCVSHTPTHTHTHPHTHTYTHTHSQHTHTYTSTHTHIHTHSLATHTYTSTHTHTHTHTLTRNTPTHSQHTHSLTTHITQWSATTSDTGRIYIHIQQCKSGGGWL